MPVRALWFERGALCLLDQRRLPGARVVRRLRRVEQVAEAIRGMTVRGAPAIGVTGAYGMALAARQGGVSPDEAARLLLATRPTAHDLSVGVGTVEAAWTRGEDPLAAADRYRETVVSECREIGRQGARLFRRRPRVLTHCNAGALATVEWGTALAPLRVAREQGAPIFVWVDETRPLLQGSRLTAWELAEEGIPHAVIADNAAGHFMREGSIDAAIVGADRIALNGDVANKIGTYEKAVLARENGLPFYVAAPWATFDRHSATGRVIPIEERGMEELQRIGRTRLSPPRSPARNPAFDVTPAKYITAYVTPSGVYRANELRKIVTGRGRGDSPRPP